MKRLMEQEQTNTSTLKVQEALSATVRRDVDQLVRKIDTIELCVHRIEVMSAGKTQCTAPNLCLELKVQVEKLATTVQTLVENRAEARGMGKMVIILGTIFGSAGGALVTYIIHLLSGGRTP